jgi:hypothetical protein
MSIWSEGTDTFKLCPSSCQLPPSQDLPPFVSRSQKLSMRATGLVKHSGSLPDTSLCRSPPRAPSRRWCVGSGPIVLRRPTLTSERTSERNHDLTATQGGILLSLSSFEAELFSQVLKYSYIHVLELVEHMTDQPPEAKSHS